jgi:hypothetical protein
MSESVTKTARILKLLKTNGSATNRELNRICFRYSARLYELRREKHVILTERITENVFRYTYKGEEAQETN